MEENRLYNESPCFEEGVGSVRRSNVGFLHTHYCLYMGPATPPRFFFYQQQQAQEYNWELLCSIWAVLVRPRGSRSSPRRVSLLWPHRVIIASIHCPLPKYCTELCTARADLCGYWIVPSVNIAQRSREEERLRQGYIIITVAKPLPPLGPPVPLCLGCRSGPAWWQAGIQSPDSWYSASSMIQAFSFLCKLFPALILWLYWL